MIDFDQILTLLWKNIDFIGEDSKDSSGQVFMSLKQHKLLQNYQGKTMVGGGYKMIIFSPALVKTEVPEY